MVVNITHFGNLVRASNGYHMPGQSGDEPKMIKVTADGLLKRRWRKAPVPTFTSISARVLNSTVPALQ